MKRIVRYLCISDYVRNVVVGLAEADEDDPDSINRRRPVNEISLFNHRLFTML